MNYVKNFKSELRNIENKIANYEYENYSWIDELGVTSKNFDAIKKEKMLYINSKKIPINEFQDDYMEACDPSINTRVSSKIYPIDNKLNTNYLNDSNKLKNIKDFSDNEINRKTTTKQKNQTENNGINVGNAIMHKDLDANALKRKSAKLPNNRTTSLINTSSWKDSELLVNEHFKKLKKDIKNDSLSTEILGKHIKEDVIINRDDNNKKLTSKLIENADFMKRINKNNEDHIFQINFSDKLNQKKNEFENIDKTKKAYDLVEIRRFMEQQKSKRMQSKKISKEKFKQENEKKVEKLQSLLRKQRENTMNKQKNNSQPIIEDFSDADSIIDKKKEIEIQNLLDNNFETMSKKFSADIKDLNDYKFDLNEKRILKNAEEGTLNNIINTDIKNESLNNEYFILKHERLKSICNLALELQTKLHETSVNVLNFSPQPAKTTKNNDIDNVYYETFNNYEEKETEFIDHKSLIKNILKTKFNDSLPGNTKKYEVDVKQENIEHNDYIMLNNLSGKNHRQNGLNTFSAIKKLEKPSWTIESDNFSFLKLTREKLKRGKHVKSESQNNSAFITHNDYKSKVKTTTSPDSPRIIINKTVDQEINMEDLKKQVSLKNTEHYSEASASDVSTISNIDSRELLEVNLSVKTDTKLQTENEKNYYTVIKEEKIPRDSKKPLEDYDNQLSEKTTKIGEFNKNIKRSYNTEFKLKQESSTRNATKNTYSPETLDKMMTAGLNYLETLNFSTIQLEEFDKVRCVGLAQNENVLLAHFLRNHQLEKDIKNLKQKSNEEVISTLKDNKNLLSEIQNKINVMQNQNSLKLNTQSNNEISEQKRIRMSKKYSSSETETSEQNSVNSTESKPNYTVEISTKINSLRSDTDNGTISTETLEDDDTDMSETSSIEKSTKKEIKTSSIINESTQKSNIKSESSVDIKNNKRQIHSNDETTLISAFESNKKMLNIGDKKKITKKTYSSNEEPNYSYKIPHNILAKREKDLEFRRKRLEELIRWKTKLDNEEKNIKEKEREVSALLSSAHTKNGSPEKESSKPNLNDTYEKNQKKLISNNEDDIITDSVLIPKDDSYTQSFISDSNVYKKSHTTEKDEKSKKWNSSIQESIVTASKYEDNIKTEEDAISSASSKTETTDQTEIKAKIDYLQKELLKKKKDAEKLKKDLSYKNKIVLKEKALKLEKKIGTYDSIINKMRDQLVEDEKDEEFSSIVTFNSYKKNDEIITEKIKSSNVNSDVLSNKFQDPDINSEPKENTKYDEDFTSEENKSEDKTEYKNEQLVDNFKEYSDRDDMKSTISDISENIKNDDIDNGSVKNYDNDSDTNDSDSSTDTQILLLGTRVSKPTETILLGNTKEDIVQVKNKPEDHKSISVDEDEDEDENENEKLEATLSKEENLINENILGKIEILLVENSLDEMLFRRKCKAVKSAFSKNVNLERNFFNEENIITVEAPTLQNEIVKLPNTRDPVIPFIDLDQKLTNDLNSLESLLKDTKNFGLNQIVPEFRVAGYTKEQIQGISKNLVDNIFWNLIQEKINVTEYQVPVRNFKINDTNIHERKKIIESLKNENNLNETKSFNINDSFNELIFDLIGEIVHDLYREDYEQSLPVSVFVPGFKIPFKKQFFKNSLIGPKNKTEANRHISLQIENILKLPSKKSELSEFKQTERKSKWRLQKRLDLVDNLLDKEMRDEENEWSVYEKESIEAKLMMADIIFETLLRDVITSINNISSIKKKKSSQIKNQAP